MIFGFSPSGFTVLIPIHGHWGDSVDPKLGLLCWRICRPGKQTFKSLSFTLNTQVQAAYPLLWPLVLGRGDSTTEENKMVEPPFHPPGDWLRNFSKVLTGFLHYQAVLVKDALMGTWRPGELAEFMGRTQWPSDNNGLISLACVHWWPPSVPFTLVTVT